MVLTLTDKYGKKLKDFGCQATGLKQTNCSKVLAELIKEAV